MTTIYLNEHQVDVNDTTEEIDRLTKRVEELSERLIESNYWRERHCRDAALYADAMVEARSLIRTLLAKAEVSSYLGDEMEACRQAAEKWDSGVKQEKK